MARRRRNIFAPSESLIQAACLEHWLKLGVPGSLVAAIPNAGAMGQPGLTCGLADLLVLGPRVPGGVGFIELKKDHKSVVTEAQREFGDLCRRLGVSYALCVGRDGPIMALEEWGVVRRQAA